MALAGNRRDFIVGTSRSAGIAAIISSLGSRLLAEDAAAANAVAETGRTIKHSACRWCYNKFSLDEICEAGKEFGLQSVEIIQPSEVATVRKYGMTCAMAANVVAKTPDGKSVGSIGRGWNELENHDTLVPAYEKQIRDAADAGLKNVICFSGNRRGMDDEVGMKNCAAGIKRLMPLCEKLGVTLSMELLNSKRSHKDYMCDRTPWGVELCKLVGSENFKLLYDIFHMQIMEGDVISTIKENHQFISHYHTGGVPGRGEIDDTQELHYPAIVKAILETGYDGYLGQEFIPRRKDHLASLRQGVEICSVAV